MGLSECLTLLARRHLDESVNMVHIVNMVHVVTDPPRRTVEERREERIGQILDRAMEIIENEGEGALTLQRLAGSLGMVTTALYRYFSSKDALMAALQRRAIGVVQKHFQARMGAVAGRLSTTAPPTAAIVMLLSIADLYLELPRTHPDLFLLIAVLFGDPRLPFLRRGGDRTAPLLEGFLGTWPPLRAGGPRRGPRAGERERARDRLLVRAPRRPRDGEGEADLERRAERARDWPVHGAVAPPELGVHAAAAGGGPASLRRSGTW